MTKSNKTIIAAVAAALLICPNYAHAGSTKPNPAALAKAAGKTSEGPAVVNEEFRSLLARLAKGDEFTKQFDQAVYKKDKKELMKLIQQGGMKKSKVTIENISSDFRLRLGGCFLGFCGFLDLSW